ncbi:MAG: glycosyltransferase family 4 protein [Deltaproteobacteria bacterium]|nr:glycosyltransferase family 4 protein [Deltaproteobacteria bacterium]
MKPIAIVIPWFGRGLKGGAEQQAWQIATRLARRGFSIEVLTTCCRAFHEDWATNHLKAGSVSEDRILIRRFPVNSRDRSVFDEVNSRMLNIPHSDLRPGVNPVSKDESVSFVKENINSAHLLEYLECNKREYQAFLFIPYLYGIIINGLPIVCDHAFLQPCLHDEVYAYLPEIEYIFHKAKGVLFNSEGELNLAVKLYGPGIKEKSTIVGEGVEVTSSGNRNFPIRLLGSEGLRFVLYLGRREPTKNVDLLVNSYADFRQSNSNSDLALVLAGPGNTSYDGFVNGVMDLGFIAESEKSCLLKHCKAVFQPSRNESYSRVIMEAWLYGKPVAVNAECLATAGFVGRSKGGWTAASQTEWSNLFSIIDSLSDRELDECGKNGRDFACENADWDRVIDSYEMIIKGLTESKSSCVKHRGNLLGIHQLLASASYGDAISNHALDIRDYLRERGYESDIFAEHLDLLMAEENVKAFSPHVISGKSGIIYHHSIGSGVTYYAIQHSGPKCLIYHNITPGRFFSPYRPDFCALLEKGRSDLKNLSESFPLAVGVSAFNEAELIEAGFKNTLAIHIGISPRKWDNPPNSGLMKSLQDGVANLLFVGRISPNKCQHHLISAFSHYLSMDPNARLIIIGEFLASDPYYKHLMNMLSEKNLYGHVVVPGKVRLNELHAFYRTADLFWSMSEHEGFCVPLIEAMWFDVPILAYNSSAVPETLGTAGLMFNGKKDLISVAALAKVIIRNEHLKEKILKAQRERRTDFTPENVRSEFDELLNVMEGQVR